MRICDPCRRTLLWTRRKLPAKGGDVTLIRAAAVTDSLGLAKVHVDTWKATYRGMVSDGFLDGLSYERSANGWSRTLASGTGNRVFLAEDDQGAVVGFASGGPNRDVDTPLKAELYAIYIYRDQQRHGLGRGLLRRLAEAVAADGLDSLVAWALATNAPARRFYEAMQGTVAGKRVVQIGGQPLEEVAYGWPDIQALVR